MKKIAQNEAKNCFWYIAQHCNCLIKQEKQTMIYVMRISHRLPASCLWIVCGWSHIYIYCHIVPVARCHVPRDSHEEEARAEKCAMSQQQSIESLSVTRCFEVSETFFFRRRIQPTSDFPDLARRMEISPEGWIVSSSSSLSRWERGIGSLHNLLVMANNAREVLPEVGVWQFKSLVAFGPFPSVDSDFSFPDACH